MTHEPFKLRSRPSNHLSKVTGFISEQLLPDAFCQNRIDLPDRLHDKLQQPLVGEQQRNQRDRKIRTKQIVQRRGELAENTLETRPNNAGSLRIQDQVEHLKKLRTHRVKVPAVKQVHGHRMRRIRAVDKQATIQRLLGQLVRDATHQLPVGVQDNTSSTRHRERMD